MLRKSFKVNHCRDIVLSRCPSNKCLVGRDLRTMMQTVSLTQLNQLKVFNNAACIYTLSLLAGVNGRGHLNSLKWCLYVYVTKRQTKWFVVVPQLFWSVYMHGFKRIIQGHHVYIQVIHPPLTRELTLDTHLRPGYSSLITHTIKFDTRITLV